MLKINLRKEKETPWIIELWDSVIYQGHFYKHLVLFKLHVLNEKETDSFFPFSFNQQELQPSCWLGWEAVPMNFHECSCCNFLKALLTLFCFVF
jgi:hypothetical protein